MPRALPLIPQSWLRGALAATAALLLGISPVADAAKALVNVEVPAGKWKGAKLKNLPKDARVGIRVETSGSLDVILIHADELKRFPAAVSPEFQGSAERKLAFSAVIPRAGDYYVILDNRPNDTPRKVKLLIQAERAKTTEPPANPASPTLPPGIKKGKETDI